MEQDHKMNTLIAATNNMNKLAEIRRILSPYFDTILSAKEAGIELDVEEDTDTFLGNSKKKAVEFMQASGVTAVADDSGLCVDFLNGEPGVYSARYMGPNHTDAAAVKYILEQMKDVPEEQRTARFVTAAVVAYPDGTFCSAIGKVEGKISFEARGENGFGYDPIFCPEGRKETFGELSDEEKNAISHRGRAMRALAEKMLRGEKDDACEAK